MGWAQKFLVLGIRTRESLWIDWFLKVRVGQGKVLSKKKKCYSFLFLKSYPKYSLLVFA